MKQQQQTTTTKLFPLEAVNAKQLSANRLNLSMTSTVFFSFTKKASETDWATSIINCCLHFCRLLYTLMKKRFVYFFVLATPSQVFLLPSSHGRIGSSILLIMLLYDQPLHFRFDWMSELVWRFANSCFSYPLLKRSFLKMGSSRLLFPYFRLFKTVDS